MDLSLNLDDVLDKFSINEKCFNGGFQDKEVSEVFVGHVDVA